MQYILDTMQYIYYNCNIKMMEEGERMAINRVKLARMEKEITQLELAKICEVTRQTISLIESGKYNPTLSLCISICRALDKSLNELFWEE